MVGGTGDDTYVVNVATDVVTELANEGFDTVRSGVTLTLGANVENLVLTGTTAIKGTGNALDNVLTGNSAKNTARPARFQYPGQNSPVAGGDFHRRYQKNKGQKTDHLRYLQRQRGTRPQLRFHL